MIGFLSKQLIFKKIYLRKIRNIFGVHVKTEPVIHTFQKLKEKKTMHSKILTNTNDTDIGDTCRN